MVNLDDDQPDHGPRILISCAVCVVAAGAALAAELTVATGALLWICAAATVAAPFALVTPAAAALRAQLTRRRSAAALRVADSLRLEQLHERAAQRPAPRDVVLPPDPEPDPSADAPHAGTDDPQPGTDLTGTAAPAAQAVPLPRSLPVPVDLPVPTPAAAVLGGPAAVPTSVVPGGPETRSIDLHAFGS